MTRKRIDIPEELRLACIELTRLADRHGWDWELDATRGRCTVTLHPPPSDATRPQPRPAATQIPMGEHD